MTEQSADTGQPAEQPAGPARPNQGPRRRPGAGAVIWGSVALFAVIFALLTQQLSAGTAPAPRPVLVRKVIKRRIVTTIPTPGRSQVTSSGSVTGSAAPEYAPVTTGAS